jgi:hypothetical protein
VLELEKRQKEKELAGYSQLLLSLGAPDCPVVHRTVSGAPGWRWSTGRSWELDDGVRLSFNRLSGGAPDCPVSQRSVAQSARDAWPGQRSDGGTGLSGVHRTVSSAPMAPKTSTVGCARIGKQSAPDCPVHHPTEGKDSLPGLL